jgi:hypothetical protein
VHKTYSLTIGGQVLWSYYSKRPLPHVGSFWMASRLPPARDVSARMVLNLTDTILSNRILDELWDSRFRIKFFPLSVPPNLTALLRKGNGTLCLVPHGKLCIPRLLWTEWDGGKMCSYLVDEHTEVKFKLPKNALQIEWIREFDDP